MKHFINLIFSSLLFCGLAGTASADTHPAKAKLVNAVDAVLDALFDEKAQTLSQADKRVRVRESIDDKMDFSFVILRAFGRNWQQMNEAQQVEAVDLITETLITVYVDSFAGSKRPQMEFGRVVEVTPNRVEIPSKVEVNGNSVELLYRMGRMQSGWELFDVVAEGVSMVANYRQQFDNHFRRGNGAGLVKRFREMADKGEVDL